MEEISRKEMKKEIKKGKLIFKINTEEEGITVKEKEKEQKQKYIMGELTGKQKEQFDKLIKKNEDIFVRDKNELGRTNVVKHKVDTGNEKPIKQRAYRMGPKEKKIIKEEVDKMLAKGAIRKSKSPWAAPVVLVRKKNGEIRFCIDFRKLNNITKKDNYPLPRIDDMLEQFAGSKWFTSLDLASGYWQVEMDEKDKEKTAFITHEGLYEFNVMPFGLCNAPPTFQRLMHEVYGDLIYTKAPVYIDDTNVHSKTFEQHLKDLEEVFGKIREAGLKLRLDKCHFCFQEIKFLGFIIGKNGIKTDEEKVEKIKNYKKPNNITELRGFLGLAGYYRKFVKDFAKIAKPLTKLTKEGIYEEEIKRIKKELKKKHGKEWEEKHKREFQKRKGKIIIDLMWDKEQQESFEELKNKLMNAPILIYPNFDKEFMLCTDASGYALGAVLQQKDEENREQVIAYAHKTLTDAEKNYSTGEKELYAVLWAVEKFHHYLYGSKFTVVTDHRALKWLNNTEMKERKARWIYRLMPYDFEMIYKEGRKHINADFLSRLLEVREEE